MINAIPVLGWIISLIVHASLAVPFWWFWTVCGIGRAYAYWLPSVYQTPGFWDTVMIFVVMSIIKVVFVPRLATGSYSSSDNKKG